MDTMFYYASSFEGKGLASWDTSSVVVFDRMFSGAIAFRGGGLSNWNVENAQFMEKMVRKRHFLAKHVSLFPAVRRSEALFPRSLFMERITIDFVRRRGQIHVRKDVLSSNR